MLNETRVATSHSNGMFMHLDACSMYAYINGLALSVITECRNITFNARDSIIEYNTNIPHYDALVEKYISGIPSALIGSMLEQNVQILYRFVEDCVLNDSVKGLYLLRERSRFGLSAWRLIPLALSEYMNLVREEYKVLGKQLPSNLPKYNSYNDRFEKMMEEY